MYDTISLAPSQNTTREKRTNSDHARFSGPAIYHQTNHCSAPIVPDLPDNGKSRHRKQPASVARPATSSLNLPKLGINVPTLLINENNHHLEFKTAQDLVENGCVKDQDIDPHLSLGKTILNAVQRRTGLNSDSLNHMDLNFSIGNINSADFYQSEKEKLLTYEIELESLLVSSLRAKLPSVAKGNMRVMKAVMATLNLINTTTIEIFGPILFEQTFVCQYYQGEENWRDFVRFLIMNGMDPREEEMPRPDLIRKEWPSFCFSSFEEFQRTTSEDQEPGFTKDPLLNVRNLMSEDLQESCDNLISKIINWHKTIPIFKHAQAMADRDDQLYPIPPAVLTWQDFNPEKSDFGGNTTIMQTYFDWMDHHVQISSFHTIDMHFADINTPGACSKAFEGFCSTIDLLIAADKLLDQISIVPD